METTMRRGARRWALTAGIGVVAVGALSFSAFGYFSTTINDDTQADTGTMTMRLGDDGNDGANKMSIAAEDIAPGDVIERALTLTLAGSVATKNVHFTTEDTGNDTILTTNTVQGLQLKIERCSDPWTVDLAPGTTRADAGGNSYAQDHGYKYSCPAEKTTVAWEETPVIQNDVMLTKTALNIPATAGNAPNHLRIKLRFPDAAGNSFQDGSTCADPGVTTGFSTCENPDDDTSMKAIIKFTFFGDQRNGVQK